MIKYKTKMIRRLFSKDMSQRMFLITTICLVSLLVVMTGVAALRMTSTDEGKQVRTNSIPSSKNTQNDDKKSSSTSQPPNQSDPEKSQSPRSSDATIGGNSSTDSPSFSINPSQISLTAGQTSSSIKLQSSSGKVYWKIEGSSLAVYDMLDDGVSLHAAIVSASFHIGTSASATAKTYQFTVRASTDSTFRSKVASHTLSVTVKPAPDFKVSFGLDEVSGSEDGSQLYIPYTITRIGGHAGYLSPSATIIHAPAFHSITLSAYTQTSNSGVVSVSIPPGTTPGDYFVSISLYDSATSTTRSDTCIVQVLD